jgi:hypothetical protein
VGWALIDGQPELQNPMSTPEPSTVALLAAGFLALALLQFRRQIHA